MRKKASPLCILGCLLSGYFAHKAGKVAKKSENAVAERAAKFTLSHEGRSTNHVSQRGEEGRPFSLQMFTGGGGRRSFT